MASIDGSIVCAMRFVSTKNPHPLYLQSVGSVCADSAEIRGFPEMT